MEHNIYFIKNFTIYAITWIYNCIWKEQNESFEIGAWLHYVQYSINQHYSTN